MKNIALLFCGILFTIAFSYTGLILASQLQFGSLLQTTAELDEDGKQIEGDRSSPVAKAVSLCRARTSTLTSVASIATASRFAAKVTVPTLTTAAGDSPCNRSPRLHHAGSSPSRHHAHRPGPRPCRRPLCRRRWPRVAPPAPLQPAAHLQRFHHAAVPLPLRSTRDSRSAFSRCGQDSRRLSLQSRTRLRSHSNPSSCSPC